MRKRIVSLLAAAAAVTAVSAAASAETATINMVDGGYGINGGASFTVNGIEPYASTLGDLSDLYDTIDFTISVADLGGRDDLLFQVYVSADDWGVWANGDETPAITEAGTEYTFSLNVDDIAAQYGADKVICDMGFQILSATPGSVDVTYNAEFSSSSEAPADVPANAENSSESTESKGSPDTGVEGAGAAAALAIAAGGAMLITGKRRK